MLKGIHLTLLIGPLVPVPAPQSVIDALHQRPGDERHATAAASSSRSRSSKNSPLLTTLLPAGYFDPMVTRVIIIVTVSGMPHVLMDGIVTRQEIAPSNEPGQSTLTITGEDLSVLMDLVEMPSSRIPAMPIDRARLR